MSLDDGSLVSDPTQTADSQATLLFQVWLMRAMQAVLGDELTARGEVLRRGRHIAFAEGNLFDAEGRRLSQARGTWYIWSASDSTPRTGAARSDGR